MRRRIVMEDLGNMNPGELEPRPWNGGETDFTNDSTIGSLPEKECMKARMAAFQAIMEEVIDNTIDEAQAENKEPAEVTSEVYDTAEDVTDKAVALHLIPAATRNVINKLVAYKLRPRKSRAALYARAAHLCAEAVTSDSSDPAYNAGTPAIDTPIEASPESGDYISTAVSENSETPADGTSPTTAWWRMDDSVPAGGTADDPAYNAGTPAIDTPIEASPESGDYISTAVSENSETPAEGTSPTTAWWKMEDDDVQPAPADDTTPAPAEDDSAAPADAPAEGDPESPEDTPTESSDAVNPEEVQVDEGVDKDTAAEMQYLITAACHHRRATSKVSRRFSGKIVNRMLHELRYKLPASFVRKYGID